jgi:hypothetical protein
LAYRSCIFLLALVVTASTASCGNIIIDTSGVYVAQAPAGDKNGRGCSNALALGDLTPADWVPGNTIHLCGTITFPAGSAGLVAQGSGTATSPITIKFEPGAILQSPQFGGSSGCWSLETCNAGIEVLHQNYIVIDGGTNGIIQNTANGTDLTYHSGSAGIVLSGSNFIVRNLTIRNIYINDPSTGTDVAGSGTADVVVLNSEGVTVCNNTLSNSRSGISSNTVGGPGPTYPLPSCASNKFSNGTNLFGNTLSDHCWQIQAGGTNGSVVNVFNNDLSGASNWVYSPNPANYYHTDGVMAWGNAGAQVIVYLFNNYFHDTAFGTAAFYCTYGEAGSGCAAYVFNNVFSVDSAEANKSTAIWLNGSPGYPLGPYYIYNNTFVNNGYMLMLAGDNEAVTIENNLVSEGTTGYNYFYIKGYGSNPLTTVLTTADYNSFYGGRGLSFNGPGAYWCWPASGATPSGCGSSYSGPWIKTGFDTHSVSGNPQINASYQPSSNSPDIRAGANLSSLCATPGLGPLCYDKNGVARPLTGPWDIGAFQ